MPADERHSGHTFVGMLLCALAALPAAAAPARSSCGSAEAREFDFWIGDWDIRQKILRQDGTWLELDAETSVAATLDGCALVEHWTGSVQFFWEGMQAPEPMQGLSVRAFDPESRKWHIYWMDTRTPSFGSPYTGAFDSGRGEFFREWETPQGSRTGRITFSDMTADAVRWELAVSSDAGDSWTPLWIMEMRRAAN